MLKTLKKNIIMVRECIKMSLDNIKGNKVRSFLTILGIMIGVTAVIALITTVSGVSDSLSSEFESLGAGSLSVSISGSDLKSGLTSEELTELAQIDEIDGITPSVSLTARVSRGKNYDTGLSVSGKSSYFFKTTDAVLRGRKLNKIDEDNRSYVCLINEEMVTEYFYGEDPIGESLNINGISFTVVGIFSDDASASIMDLLTGGNDVFIPYTTAMKMNNTNVVTSFTVYMKDGVETDAAEDLLEDNLDPMFSFEEDCYTITTMEGIEDTMETMLSMMSGLLAGIASIALVVGGIGIMNMMLTTVTERTMEIGLKKALGAIPWQIQMQFLIESFMLSLIGGILGILMGLLLSLILCKVMGSNFALSVNAIILGFGFSAAVGIIFGWAPARKASKLNPIDALRSM